MDGARTIVELLNSKWDEDNVGETPNISLVYDVKRFDLGQGESAIYVYQVATTEDVNSLTALTKELRERFTIDIRTTISRDRLIAIEKEVRRILELYCKNFKDVTDPSLIWDFVQPQSSVDRSDKSIKLYRYTMDCEMVAFATIRNNELLPQKPLYINLRVAHDNQDVGALGVQLWLCDETKNQIKELGWVQARYFGVSYAEKRIEITAKDYQGVWYYIQAVPVGSTDISEYLPIYHLTTGGTVIVRANIPQAGNLKFYFVNGTSSDPNEWSFISKIDQMYITIHNDRDNSNKTISLSNVDNGFRFKLNPYERVYNIECISNTLGATKVSASDTNESYFNGIRVQETVEKDIFIFIVNKSIVPVYKFQIWNVYCSSGTVTGSGEIRYCGGDAIGVFNLNTIQISDDKTVHLSRNEFDISGDETCYCETSLNFSENGQQRLRNSTDWCSVTNIERNNGFRVIQFYTDFNTW